MNREAIGQADETGAIPLVVRTGINTPQITGLSDLTLGISPVTTVIIPGAGSFANAITVGDTATGESFVSIFGPSASVTSSAPVDFQNGIKTNELTGLDDLTIGRTLTVGDDMTPNESFITFEATSTYVTSNVPVDFRNGLKTTELFAVGLNGTVGQIDDKLVIGDDEGDGEPFYRILTRPQFVVESSAPVDFTNGLKTTDLSTTDLFAVGLNGTDGQIDNKLVIGDDETPGAAREGVPRPAGDLLFSDAAQTGVHESDGQRLSVDR